MRDMDHSITMDEGLSSMVYGQLLYTLQEGEISKERPEVTGDFCFQPRRTEDFGEFPVDVVVGFLELV